MPIFTNKVVNPFANKNLSPTELYIKLKNYYDSNQLYDDVMSMSYYNNTWVEQMKPIRNPVNRSVEFYVAKVAAGKLEIITKNEKVKQAIEQFLKWSNFDSQKQISKRYLSLYGDLFWKVVNGDSKIYSELIEPKNVTSFTSDSRGYLASIRIDINIQEDGIDKTYTEFWQKDDTGGYFASWVHTQGRNVALEQLGDPREMATLNELGINFIPILHIKFRDIGNERGSSCVLHCLDKIDEANRQATRLHSLLYSYNNPVMVISANSLDKDGRPMAAPRPKSLNANNSETDIEMKDKKILYLNGMATVNNLIPDLNYGDALKILQDMMLEIENDLPELSYYSLKDSNASGKSLKIQLGAAVDRANEANDNFIQGLIRMNEMALTLGSNANLFFNLGSYENGDFTHSIKTDDMFPMDIFDRATTVKSFVDAGMPLADAMKFADFTQEEIDSVSENKKTEDEKAQNQLANSLLKFNQISK